MALHPRVSAAYKVGLEKINGRLMGTHQHLGVQWMLERELLDEPCKGGLLADDCGCGKTYITTCLIKANPVPCTLIVTVVSTIHQWRDILTTFGRTPPLIVSSDCMLRSVPTGTSIVLTTYSVFTPKKKIKTLPPILKNTHWDRIVLDEGHTVKNAKGTTFQNINKMASSMRWVLSATPVQNSWNDLQTLATWIGWQEDIEKFIDKKMIRRTLAQEGEKNPRFKLPKLVSEVVRLDFTLEQEKKLYESIEGEYKTRIEQTSEGWKLYTEALQGILRCRQVCCHFKILDQPVFRKRKFEEANDDVVESTKFSFICNDIAQNPKEKAIIFCMWTKEIEIMLRCLDKHGISALKFDGSLTKEAREMTLYNFKQTNIQALVIQIQAGGVGLNLQCATRVYITSPTWNPTHEIQAICRSHRLGQDHIVKCFRLIIKDTIEERMIDIQNKKLEIISEALDDKELFSKMCDVDAVDSVDIRTLFG